MLHLNNLYTKSKLLWQGIICHGVQFVQITSTIIEIEQCPKISISHRWVYTCKWSWSVNAKKMNAVQKNGALDAKGN